MQTLTLHEPLKYRADIDGLRAVAVLLVVLDHLRFHVFHGGYIGVDVFFVISGYLIGSSMLAEFRAGTFSLITFYERRVRRIFPALLVMLAVTSAVAYGTLLPRAFVTYAYSQLAALFLYSNVFFSGQTGYFIRRSTKPLLHTWSLGVEEQFYLLFPLLLYVLFRWCPKPLRVMLWVLTGLSFMAACLMLRTNPNAAFFWSPLRAWELLAGVIVSQYGVAPLRIRWLREVATIAGLALILGAGLFYTIRTPFPGLTAVVPCMGTVLLLAAGQAGASTVGGLLALPPLRFIGLISYSLYLWHWPLVVFQNMRMSVSRHPSWERSSKVSTLVASLVMAVLSWWWVESPFRKGRWRPARQPLFFMAGVAVSVLAGFSVYVIHEHGIQSRFPPDVQRLARFENDGLGGLWRDGVCFLQPTSSFHDFKPAECLGSVAGQRTYLLYGDSTAAQLYPGLVKTFPEIHFQMATSSNCLPYEGPGEAGLQVSGNCAALREYMRGTYLNEQRPDAVILAGGWNEASLRMLGGTIADFQRRSIPVIVVGPVISFDSSLLLLLSNEMQLRRPPDLAGLDISQHRLGGQEELDRQMDVQARDVWRVRYVSHVRELCGRRLGDAWQTTDGCPLLLPGGEPLLFDSMHLSEAGSLLFARQARADGLLP